MFLLLIMINTSIESLKFEEFKLRKGDDDTVWKGSWTVRRICSYGK